MKTEKIRGIYGFRNVHTDMWYIGQSIDIQARFDQHIASIKNEKDEVKFHAALKQYPNEEDWDFQIVFPSSEHKQVLELTKTELDQLEAIYIAYHDSYKNGYNSTRGNHVERVDGRGFEEYNKNLEKDILYLVNTNLCGQILKKVKHPSYFIEGNKRVLFIRNFEQADWFTTPGNDVTVVTDLKGHVVSNANMIVTDNIKKELKDMVDKKFDLIIANPPYGKIGAEITKFIVDNFEFEQYLNLLPANDYTRTKELINHVNLDSLEMIKSGFDDASVNTHIAEITKKRKAITKEAFTLFTYDEKLQRCYETFANREHYAIDSFSYSTAPIKNPSPYSFAITRRTVQDGVHYSSYQALGGAFDVDFNVTKTVTFEDIHVDTCGMSTVDLLQFNTPEEHKNFTDWWYEGKLANMLIRGLNKTSGSCKPALPKVDWTRPWTDEQILKDCGYTDKEIEEILK